MRIAAATLMSFAMALPLAAFAQEQDEAAEVFARMDSNRDGQVSLEEFEKGIARPYGADGDRVVYQRLPARFRSIDADGSGYIEAAEFPSLLQHWIGPGLAPNLAEVDRNGDGRIDFREFALMHVPRDGANGADAASAGDSPAPEARPEPEASGRARSPRARKNTPMRRTA